MATLYSFAAETKTALNKFRLSSSRAKKPEALILRISKETQSIDIQDEDESPLTSLADIADHLPENTPRFVILSYPYTKSDGRFAAPYVMIYFRPPTATQQNLMLYAGAIELVRNQTNVLKVIEIVEEEELDGIEELL